MTRGGAAAASSWPRAFPEVLVEDEVQVYLFALDQPPLPREGLAALLSPDEQARAARFRFDIHRERFIAGRGLLRVALGHLAGRDPRGLLFTYGAKGKPALAAGSAPFDLRFNLSHSQDLGLLAVARGRELGVDIEACRTLDDAPGLVERFFAPGERRTFSTLPAEEQLAGFYTGWTIKEAYVKARGDGLSLPTSAFEVDLRPGSAAALLAFEAEPSEVARWQFTGFTPAPGFLGAVAVERAANPVAEPRLRCWA